MLINSFPSFAPQGQPKNHIKANVVVKDMYDSEQNTWPDTFIFAPRKGDQIQAEDGRRLSVLDIVHTVIGGQPMVRVEVGVDRNDVTPMEGGGSLTGGDPF